MQMYSLYDAHTGLFTGNTFGTDAGKNSVHANALAGHTPPGQLAIEGIHDHLSRKVDLAAVARMAALQEKLARIPLECPHSVVDACSCNPNDHCAAGRELVAQCKAEIADLTAAHVVDYQPPQPSPDHEWNLGAKRWQVSAAVQERAAKRQAALTQIAALEARQMRPTRDLLRDPTDIAARARLDSIEAQIAELRNLL